MTKLILSTSNIMGGRPSPIRCPTSEKSNTELITALRANFSTHNLLQNKDDQSSSSSFPLGIRQDESELQIPALDFTHSGLAEDRPQYDITAKLFYLPHVPPHHRHEHAKAAISLVLQELHISTIDLLIVSFPNLSLDADNETDDDEGERREEDNEYDTIQSTDSSKPSPYSSTSDPESISSMLCTYRSLESLYSANVVRKLGVSEFGSRHLRHFVSHAQHPPSVDQINLRDCCVVPKPLIQCAKEAGVELLTHNDCTNVLPTGTLRELLGPVELGGAGILTAKGASHGDEEKGAGLAGDVIPLCVIKYTAVVKNRGVVENKGYFAIAELED